MNTSNVNKYISKNFLVFLLWHLFAMSDDYIPSAHLAPLACLALRFFLEWAAVLVKHHP